MTEKDLSNLEMNDAQLAGDDQIYITKVSVRTARDHGLRSKHFRIVF